MDHWGTLRSPSFNTHTHTPYMWISTSSLKLKLRSSQHLALLLSMLTLSEALGDPEALPLTERECASEWVYFCCISPAWKLVILRALPRVHAPPIPPTATPTNQRRILLKAFPAPLLKQLSLSLGRDFARRNKMHNPGRGWGGQNTSVKSLKFRKF